MVQLLTKNGTIHVEDEVRQEAREVEEQRHDRHVVEVRMMLDDGEHITLPRELTDAIRFVVDGLTQGDVSIRSTPDELTSTTAAALLGISRPTLMKLVSEGQLTARKVGTHHRFAHREVMELLHRRRAAQRAAFDELRRIDDELGIDD